MAFRFLVHDASFKPMAFRLLVHNNISISKIGQAWLCIISSKDALNTFVWKSDQLKKESEHFGSGFILSIAQTKSEPYTELSQTSILVNNWQNTPLEHWLPQ